MWNLVFAQMPTHPVSFEALLSHVTTIVIFGAIIIVVGVVGYYLAIKFKQQATTGGQDDISHSLLTEIRNAYDEGELSAEEYQQIRARLANSIRESADFPEIMTVKMSEFVECEAAPEPETTPQEAFAEQHK